eukprot:6899728-Prymnesium_polylepis.2
MGQPKDVALVAGCAARSLRCCGSCLCDELTWKAPPLTAALFPTKYEPIAVTFAPPRTSKAPPVCALQSRMVLSTRVSVAASTLSAPAGWPDSTVCVRVTSPPVMESARTVLTPFLSASTMQLVSVRVPPRTCRGPMKRTLTMRTRGAPCATATRSSDRAWLEGRIVVPSSPTTFTCGHGVEATLRTLKTHLARCRAVVEDKGGIELVHAALERELSNQSGGIRLKQWQEQQKAAAWR